MNDYTADYVRGVLAGRNFEQERIISMLQPTADECDEGTCNCTSYSHVISLIKGHEQ